MSVILAQNYYVKPSLRLNSMILQISNFDTDEDINMLEVGGVAQITRQF